MGYRGSVRRRVARAFGVALAFGVAGWFVAAGVAGATADAGTTVPKGKATATLQIIEPNVTVQRAGKDVFKPGKEGQKLRVGDTIQTDATGFAQVNYTDDSFTRLDVNTTFTIVSLTDDEGNRQIKGSVDSGQTWNRTSALTESESFEQEGAGATAAVTGTAFVVSCTTPQNCTFTSVVDGITLTTVDGEIQHLDPLMECDSDEVVIDEDANLCGAPAQVTLDAILANGWIAENLFIDGQNGYEGVVEVEGLVVVSATPTIPGAPTGVSAVAANASATVSYSAPSATGGSAITGYTVTSSPGGLTCSTAGLSCVVSGLTNGTSYTFTVHATNGVGDGPESGASAAVTPATVPGAPTNVVGTRGDEQVSVAFDAPGSNGGSAITGYTVTSSPGGFSASGVGSPIVVSGLSNGTSYTFTVHATNGVGDGPESSASAAVTPATVPGAPTNVVGTRGNGEVSVAFDAPGSSGGSAITGYTVTSSPGGFTGSGAGSPIVVAGLTNGTSYTFTVHATNDVGDGPESGASAGVTPSAVPDAPTNVVGTRGNGEVSVAFDAPGSNGGSAITGYTVTSSPGGFTASGAGSPIVVSGLTNGTSYTFTVRATNDVGDGSESAASAAVTPATVPGAPTGASADAGDGQATVSFSAPASDGGSAITGYTVTSSPSGLTCSTAGLSCTVSGLTNGTSYTFTVHATNAVGNSAESSASAGVTPEAEVIAFDGSVGTASAPGTLGSYAMTAFGADPQSGSVSSVSAPGGGSVGFSTPLNNVTIGGGWATWSHGYTGDVYIVPNSSPVTLTMPANTLAFYFYAEPNQFAVLTVTATAAGGTTSGPVSVNGSSGATYFGFYAPSAESPLTSIDVSTSDPSGMAIGEFGINQAP